MSIQIKLKNSVVQDSTPSTSDLPAVGEIALNANINSIGGFMRASNNTIVKIFGPGSLSTPTATTTVPGISELATNTETTTGTATNRVVTPAGLNAVTVAERTTSNTNYVAKAGSTLTGVLTMPNGSNSAPAINFGDSDSGIFGGTNTVSLAAGGTTRLTADTGVSVVGTLAVTGAITSTSDLTIADKIIHSGDTNTAIRFPAADTVSVETGGSEAFRVDSSGRLLVGTSSARVEGNGFASSFQIEGTGFADSSQIICRNQANNAGANLILQKSRGSTLGSQTILLNNDTVGSIVFEGSDGVNTDSIASILAAVDGTPGTNDMPGRLVFSTTADGAASPTTRLTIDSAGLSTFTGDLTISSATPILNFTETNANPDYRILTDGGEFVIQNNNSGSFATKLKVITSGVNVTGAITSTGNVGIGTTSPATPLHIKGDTPYIRFEDDNDNQDWTIEARAFFGIHDVTDNAFRLVIDGDGEVGIGTTTPAAKLHVERSIAASSDDDPTFLLLKNASDGGSAIESTNSVSGSTKISFGVEGTGASTNETFMGFSTSLNGTLSEAMRIDSSGRLLIGTTTEGVANASEFTIADTGHCGMTIRSGTSHDGQIAFSDGTSGNDEFRGQIRYNHGSNYLTFVTDATERMRIDSSGRVGIGCTPTAQFDHNLIQIGNQATLGANAALSTTGQTFLTHNLYFDTSGNYQVFNTSSANEGTILRMVDGNFTFSNSAATTGTPTVTERMRIDSSGNVGIGTTSPSYKLEVSAETGISGDVRFLTGSRHKFVGGGSGNNLELGTYGSNNTSRNIAMVMDSAGSVGIGTTSPSQRVQIAGDSGDACLSLLRSNAASNNNAYGHVFFENSSDVTLASISARRQSASDDAYLQFNTTATGGSNTEKMRIDSSGNVGIGVTSIQERLHVANAGNCNITSQCTASGSGANAAVQVKSADGGDFLIQTGNAVSGGLRVYDGGASAERVRVTSGGNVSIGGNSSVGTKLHIENSSGDAHLRLRGSANYGVLFTRHSDGALTGYVGSGAAVNLGGSDIALSAPLSGAAIRFQTGGTSASDERARIDSSGNMAIGTSSPESASDHHLLTLAGKANSGAGGISFVDTSSNVDAFIFADGGSLYFNADYDNASAHSSIRFRVDGSSEKMRILSSGKILINRTNEDGSGQINLALNASGHGISTRTASNSTQTHLDFGNQNGIVGSIQTNGSGTSFNTSSDYRLKENAVAISDGITRLKTLKPYRFNFKTDSSTILDGFFAHEVSSAVPEAISGTKDAVDRDNNPIHQGIDQSKLVPLLVAAVQELIGRVETLEAA